MKYDINKSYSRLGVARRGMAGHGKARLGMAGRGMARHGKARMTQEPILGGI